MTPQKIRETEDTFASVLRSNTGVTYRRGEPISIGKHSIVPLFAGYTSYYYETSTEKDCIALHFTVGNIKSDVSVLTKQDNHVSVNYVVDTQGRIYQLFPDEYWSYHLGSSCLGGNAVMSKRTIGIEVSNYGPLKKSGDSYVDAYGSVYSKDDADVEKCQYRGYEYFCKVPDAQQEAVRELVDYLCLKHGIKRELRTELFKDDSEAKAFSGIFTHSAVRKDKFDWPDSMAIALLEKKQNAPRVTPEQIAAIMAACDFQVNEVYGKTTIVSARTPCGFVITESSSCVSPENYDRELGISIAKKRIEDQLWLLEGYALQKRLHEEG